MSIRVGALLEGDKALRRKLRRLADNAQRRVVRPAVSKALTPIVRAAKRRAPVETATLKKAIGRAVRSKPRSGTVWGGVGVRLGHVGVGPDGRKRDPSKYDHLVEFGTQHAAAKPFLRPALDEQRGQALGILKEGIRSGIAKEARR